MINHLNLLYLLESFVDLPIGTEIRAGLCAWMADNSIARHTPTDIKWLMRKCREYKERGLGHKDSGPYIDYPGIITQIRHDFAKFCLEELIKEIKETGHYDWHPCTRTSER